MNREKRMTDRIIDKGSKITQLAILIAGIVMFIVGASWKLYAEDKIDSQIVLKLKPIKDKVDSNSKQIKQIDFQGKQTLVLMKKIAGAKAVQEMEEETAIFKPKD